MKANARLPAKDQTPSSDKIGSSSPRRRGRKRVMPLDIMLGAMRALWERAEALKDRPDAEDERLALIRQASAEAHKAAAFVHPRLSSIDGSDGESASGSPASADAKLRMEANALALGSRELARRLLFAVAFAEHLQEMKSQDAPSKEKP